jgi:hypothetical protein
LGAKKQWMPLIAEQIVNRTYTLIAVFEVKKGIPYNRAHQ